MVVMTISILLVSGGVLSLNNYFAQEKINSAAGNLVSLLNLAKNYAQTNQVPTGYNGQLSYVTVQIGAAGRVQAFPVDKSTGVGTSYYSTLIAPGAPITATQISIGSLNFAAGSGRLIGDGGVAINPSLSVGITLMTAENLDISRQITVSAAGIISSFLLNE